MSPPNWPTPACRCLSKFTVSENELNTALLVDPATTSTAGGREQSRTALTMPLTEQPHALGGDRWRSWRPATDIIRRIMRDYFGYKVTFVMNITDVDDKVRGV